MSKAKSKPVSEEERSRTELLAQLADTRSQIEQANRNWDEVNKQREQVQADLDKATVARERLSEALEISEKQAARMREDHRLQLEALERSARERHPHERIAVSLEGIHACLDRIATAGSAYLLLMLAGDADDKESATAQRKVLMRRLARLETLRDDPDAAAKKAKK